MQKSLQKSTHHSFYSERFFIKTEELLLVHTTCLFQKPFCQWIALRLSHLPVESLDIHLENYRLIIQAFIEFC